MSDDAASLHAAARAAVAQGDPDRARALLERAAVAAPRSADVLMDLGRLHGAAGRFADAEVAFGKAALLARDHPEPRLALAFALSRQGKFDEAAAQLRRLVERLPGNADAWFNLGNVHRARGALGDAVRCFARAAALRPADPDPAINLGLVLAQSDRLEEAAAALRRVLAEGRPHPDVLLNLGQVLRALGSIDAARESFESALRIAPDHLGARANRAIALADAGAVDEAEREARAIVAARPECAEAHMLLASICLATARFEEGWREYRWRPERLRAFGDGPLLPVERLRGAVVVVRGEQGLGDALFFLRYLPALRAIAAEVRLDVDPRLAAILPADWNDARPDSPAPEPVTVLAGDLPGLLGPGPAPSLALAPAADRVAALRARLNAGGPPPYVGVTWEAGTRWSAQARPGELLFKRVDPKQLGAVLASAPATVVIAQRNPRPADVDAFTTGLGRRALDCADANVDLGDALALGAVLDDYVGVSNTNVHLRAAAGRAGRVLVTRPPEWRWMAEGERSPWFPGCALYRQSSAGWAEALADLGRELQHWQTPQKETGA